MSSSMNSGNKIKTKLFPTFANKSLMENEPLSLNTLEPRAVNHNIWLRIQNMSNYYLSEKAL